MVKPKAKNPAPMTSAIGPSLGVTPFMAREVYAFDDREVPLNSHRVFTLLLAVVLVGVGSAQDRGAGGQQPLVNAAVPRNAHWWTSLSDDTKNTFLDGYTAAMSHVSNRLFSECADKMKKITSKITSDGRTVPIAPSPDAAGNITQIWNLCVLGGSFDFGIEQRDLRNGVDEFYKDAQNSHVPIDVALRHVRDIKSPKNGSGIGGPQGETRQ
jgi:hypothetical protein